MRAQTETREAQAGRAETAGSLRVEELSKSFGQVVAVNGVSLRVEPGEFVCFLGPSGCGKTTLLRLIAGFEQADRGGIYFQDQPVHHLPPQQRNFGFVFQSYALFPHLTIWDNVAFGLRTRHAPPAMVKARVAELLELIGLPHMARKVPAQLSGGEQQRVALARALATSPRLLLLDEPLSALDAKIRVRLRSQILRIQRELGITTIYVTHDQEEALSIADRIVVMVSGVIQQVGTPMEIYRQPRTSFVADFVGTTNLLSAVIQADGAAVWQGQTLQLASSARPGQVTLAVRPERIHISTGETPGPNAVQGHVEGHTFLGSVVRLHVLVGSDLLTVDVGPEWYERASGGLGREVTLELPPAAITVFENSSGG
jgi:putative 2-aminoethylphosphonate ABC transporter ATP-binding protein